MTVTSNYKILFLYPNIQQCAMMPYSIGLMSALLKREEFDIGLFDCTFYLDDIGNFIYNDKENFDNVSMILSKSYVNITFFVMLT